MIGLKITDKNKVDYDFLTLSEDAFRLTLEIRLNQYVLNALYHRMAAQMRRSGAIPQKKIDNIKEFSIQDIDVNIVKNIERGMKKQIAEVFWTVKRDGIIVLNASLISALVKRKNRVSKWVVELKYNGVYKKEEEEDAG